MDFCVGRPWSIGSPGVRGHRNADASSPVVNAATSELRQGQRALTADALLSGYHWVSRLPCGGAAARRALILLRGNLNVPRKGRSEPSR